MAELNPSDIQALAKASGIDIPDALRLEVEHSLNAVLEMLDRIDVPNLHEVEPLPVIIPPSQSAGS